MPTDPALTPGTIQGLIDQLGQDLIDVLGSATVDAALKHDIEVRIKQLQVQLAHAKNELQALVAGWASQFEPANRPPGDGPIARCSWQVGCFRERE